LFRASDEHIRSTDEKILTYEMTKMTEQSETMQVLTARTTNSENCTAWDERLIT
jgi:hypothetical protein